ncbi:hypothetical protein Tco_0627865 [Tanacetum coccineum]|uniref:Uncharacterized protein n=1 Tax=Tanacetum coccineum TaxID=301880 RepID=A0ABQ4WNW2_9ASTR
MVADKMVMDIRWWCDVDGGVVVVRGMVVTAVMARWCGEGEGGVGVEVMKVATWRLWDSDDGDGHEGGVMVAAVGRQPEEIRVSDICKARRLISDEVNEPRQHLVECWEELLLERKNLLVSVPLESKELEVLEQPEQFLEQMMVDHDVFKSFKFILTDST